MEASLFRRLTGPLQGAGRLCLTLLAALPGTARTESHSILVDGRVRSYLVHFPSNFADDEPTALVLAFHGGGSNGRAMEWLTGFSRLSDREGFIVAYPDAVAGSWVDGRVGMRTKAHRKGIDDVAFVAALLDKLARRYAIDAGRVFATSISNGAIFSHYLAAKLADRFAAIAPVVGGLADPFHRQFAPSHAVSVFVIQGAVDPLMPFNGGAVAWGGRGHVIATDETVRLWVAWNGTCATPVTGLLPETDAKDGCRVRWSSWRGGRFNSEVLLYVEEDAGHTWPGGPQYLPRAIIGRVCRDFDATQAIWDFFKAHPRP